MKRLYTLALSALTLAASATIAVPTVRMTKAKAVEKISATAPAHKAISKRTVATRRNADAVTADSYTVYQNGNVGAGLNVNRWWNALMNTQEANPNGEGTVFSMTYDPNEPGGGATGPNFCAGIQAPANTTIAGPLHSATLSFKYYATTTCDITIRLSAEKQEDKKVTVAADDINKWNTVTYTVATDFPTISGEWNAWANEGQGDLFGVVVEKFSADTKVYFNDVVYTNVDTEWKKPEVEAPFCPTPAVPAQAAANVKSLLSGAYEAATWFNVGQWGQSTKYKQLTAENNAPVAQLTDFNYLGWELGAHINVADMEKMHVDFYPMTATPFAFTPISEGHEKLYEVAEADIKAGEWNSFDVDLTYFEGVDFADLFQVKFANGNGATAYLANVYFYKEGAGEEPQPSQAVEIPALELTPNQAVTYKGYTVDPQKAEGQSVPAINGEALRLYANNTITVSAKNLTKIVFTLADTNTKRYTKLTPSTGEITPAQAQGDTEITWVGDAESVTFTVGEKGELGTETNKAGQVHFTKLTVTGTPNGTGGGDEPEPGPNPEEYTWTSLGNGKYASSIMAAMYGISSEPVEVEVFEAEEAKGVYKFSGVWPELEEGLELIIDATDPTNVIVPEQNTGYIDEVDGKTLIASISAFVEKEELAAEEIITMTDGYISIPADVLMLCWPEAPADSEYETEAGMWYTGEGCTDGYAMLPGAKEPDPNTGWTSKGNATLMDGWVLPAFGIDQTDPANWYEVELQQNDKNPNLYRLVNPYAGKCPVAEYNESTRTNGYIQFDVTDPDHVAFSTKVSAGFANSELELPDLYCSNFLGAMLDYFDLETLIYLFGDTYQFSTYKNGVVTLPYYYVDDEEEPGWMSDACFGDASGDNGYTWQDANANPSNMEAAIWFPGVTPEYGSIKEITSAADGEEPVYNLRGQRVTKATVPGLYIRGNAKMIVR